jgi:cytochrome c6
VSVAVALCFFALSAWAEDKAAAPAAAPQAAAPVDGKALYDKKCAMCHGANGVAKPTAKGSANFNDPAWQQATTDEAIAKVTLEGKGKMPKYEGKLTAGEVAKIVEHIRTLK